MELSLPLREGSIRNFKSNAWVLIVVVNQIQEILIVSTLPSALSLLAPSLTRCSSLVLVTRDPSSDGKTHSGAIGKMYAILQEEGFFQHILSQSEDWSDLHCKVNGLCQLDKESKMRRIDILGVPW